ncbi:MAG: NADPH-dependent F420 reductase [Candidatus Caldarchaeum sp.]|nr:NADPH-dependent F420 reductase [Candidatus Caldarchaeum sp.]
MKVAVVGGTGDLGFGLVLRLAKAGIAVAIGSRSAERAAQAAERVSHVIGAAEVSGSVNRESVKGCDVAFFTIPFEAIAEIADDVAPAFGQGCIAVSCIVSPSDIGTSSAELLASHLPKPAKVVAALHTVSASLMQDLDRPVEADTFIFGDNIEDKKTIAKLLRIVEGLRPVDGGGLRDSRFGETFTRFLIGVNKRYGLNHAGFRVTGLRDEVVWRRWGF